MTRTRFKYCCRGHSLEEGNPNLYVYVCQGITFHQCKACESMRKKHYRQIKKAKGLAESITKPRLEDITNGAELFTNQS
jgi:hypothetical protein